MQARKKDLPRYHIMLHDTPKEGFCTVNHLVSRSYIEGSWVSKWNDVDALPGFCNRRG